jgi:hypothetical protein
MTICMSFRKWLSVARIPCERISVSIARSMTVAKFVTQKVVIFNVAILSRWTERVRVNEAIRHYGIHC